MIMKRSRDENFTGREHATGPHTKRPTIVRGETSSHTRVSAAPQCLTTDDAFAYLKAVKEIFKDKKGKYDEFLVAMKEFKAQRLDTPGVIERVKEIFKDHPDLLLGFNTFLPRGYEIKLPAEEEIIKKPPVEFGHAISYVNKIKTRFQQDEHIYQAFLEILYMYRRGNKFIQDVYDEVASLFREHQDLLEEFTYFLPATSGVVQPTHRSSGALMTRRDDKVASMTRRDDKVTGCAAPKLLQHEKIEKSEKIGNVQADHDRNLDRQNYDRVPKAEKDQRKRGRDEKEKEYTENDTDDEQDSQLLSHNHKSARKADDASHKHSQVVGGGESYVELTGPSDEKKIPKSLQRKLGFFDKLKMKLGNNEMYQEFLKCLNMYTEEIISREDLHTLVGDLLGGFKDLLEGFNDFLSYCEGNEGFLASTMSKRLGDGMPVKPKVERDKEKERVEKDLEKDPDKDGGDLKRDLEKERDKDKLVSQAPREPPITKASLPLSKEKYLAKPISELDLTNCERCTPSYRLLPKSYPKPIASLRSEWAHSVLNDKWVSVTSGSEDYSFKHMRKNQYEESLFRCEDDRFELDMLLETTAVTIQRVEELLQKLQEVNGTQDGQIQIEVYLKAIHLRCIERIYGDHGLDVVDLLRKNVLVALPVILTRLKQKRDEWTHCRAEMNKIWAEVYAKNYHKSLDHCSFYFKQQDKKSLSTKALLTEIKEISEKKRRDDDFILSIAAGNSQTYSPDLSFEYVDKSIYADLYQIIKYSADELCSSMEQSGKVMKLWIDFVEPFFGLPARRQGTEDTEDVLKVKLSKAKALGSDNVTVNGSFAKGKATDKRHPSSKHHSFLTDDQTLMSNQKETGKSGSFVSGLGSKPPSDRKGDANGQDHSSSLFLGHSEQVHGCDKLGHSSAELKLSPQDPSRSILSKANFKSCRDSQPEKNVDIKLNCFGKDADCTESKVDSLARKDAGGEISLDVSNGRLEREEGELSPSPEVEERHANTGQCSKMEQSRPDEDDGDYDAEVEVEPDADADDEGEESGQRTGDGEESENGSEPGEGNSGTESGEGDDSLEDHEDEEDEDGICRRNESESEAEVMADTHEQGTTSPSWDLSLHACMPLPVHGPSISVEQASVGDCTVFYGNDNLYVLFRLHQTLYERILSAKMNAMAAERKLRSNKDGASADLYEKFMQTLYSLLDGSADNAKFEDDCRAIIGTQSYVLFTLDKLIYKLVKQLQAAASDEAAAKFLALSLYEKSRPLGGFIDAVYHANANVLSHEENLYRFEHTASCGQLSIQLMGERSSERFELTANAMDQKFSKYLRSFLVPAAEEQEKKGIFLSRNKHRLYGEDDVTSFSKAMKNVFVTNGLEYKISCNSSKVSYVLDTRDFFFRKHRRRKISVMLRVQKFRHWLDTAS